MHFTLFAAILFGILGIGIGLRLWLRKQESVVYLLFFTTFYVYLFKVLDYTLFQYQSLILMKVFNPRLILRGETAANSINLLPLVGLTPRDIKTSLLNILLLIPFGFGLPFITSLRIKQVVVAGALFSIAIEILQFLTGWIGGVTFRVADINDVIFNTLGAAIGYLLFLGFLRGYRFLTRIRTIPTTAIGQYITNRPQN